MLLRLIFKDRFPVVRIPLVCMVKFKFIAVTRGLHYPSSHVQSYSLFVLVFMWLFVLSLSKHRQNLLIYCVLSIFVLTHSAQMTLFCFSIIIIIILLLLLLLFGHYGLLYPSLLLNLLHFGCFTVRISLCVLRGISNLNCIWMTVIDTTHSKKKKKVGNARYRE